MNSGLVRINRQPPCFWPSDAVEAPCFRGETEALRVPTLRSDLQPLALGGFLLCSAAMNKTPPPSLFALGPFPIEGAPPIDNLVLLLFCPEQGGWHTGVRFEGRWLSHISTEIELRPTHWLPAPPDPPGFDQ